MGVFHSQSPRALFVIPGLTYLFWWLIFSNWRIRHSHWCPYPGCILSLLYFQIFFAPVHTFLFTFHPDICEQKPVNRAQNILKVIINQMVVPYFHPLSWILPHLFFGWTRFHDLCVPITPPNLWLPCFVQPMISLSIRSPISFDCHLGTMPSWWNTCW